MVVELAASEGVVIEMAASDGVVVELEALKDVEGKA